MTFTNYTLVKKSYLLILFAAITFTACKKEKENIVVQEERATIGKIFTQDEINEQSVQLNPSGYAPLTAYINLQTSTPTTAMVRVVGKNGASSDIVKNYTTASTSHQLPVMGLYADHQNVVELTLYDESGKTLGSSAIFVETGAISADMPGINIDVPAKGDASELRIVSYFGTSTSPGIHKPFIFDSYGDIRWYLDFTNHPQLNKLNFQDGVEKLANGNLYFGDFNSNLIYEVNFMGEVANTWELESLGFQFHHHILELPNGNFLITVTNNNINTVNDFIIEMDRNTKQVVTEWDLRQSLQPTRDAIWDRLDNWIHVNAVMYSPSDDCIVISGRNQGVMKLDRNNKVKWILTNHKGWATAGDGTDLTTKLLHPLDESNRKITDWRILNGLINHPSFEWIWYQHAPKLMPNGNILLFDNGDNRNYNGNGPESYSRAVEYAIDEENMTVKQMWQYGKQRGSATFSRIVSDVDYYPATNSVVFTPGACVNGGNAYGKIVEVDKATSAVLFEATINPPAATRVVTMHRSDKITF